MDLSIQFAIANTIVGILLSALIMYYSSGNKDEINEFEHWKSIAVMLFISGFVSYKLVIPESPIKDS